MIISPLSSRQDTQSFQPLPSPRLAHSLTRRTFHSSDQVQNATKDLPPEQQEQIKGALGQAMQSGTQAVGALGGGVKGLGDTVGNTVSD